MTTTIDDVSRLYRARKGRVDLVDVPDLGYLVLDGHGRPDLAGATFSDDVRALFSIAYRMHFMLKKQAGAAPPVMPLEALWWIEGSDPNAFAQAHPAQWRWRALLMQPEPIDQQMFDLAQELERGKHGWTPMRVRYERWAEGRCAQTIHVGPFASVGQTVSTLHSAIASAGLRPRGRHHEIYLGNSRPNAAGAQRTLVRQPVEPQP